MKTSFLGVIHGNADALEPGISLMIELNWKLKGPMNHAKNPESYKIDLDPAANLG